MEWFNELLKCLIAQFVYRDEQELAQTYISIVMTICGEAYNENRPIELKTIYQVIGLKWKDRTFDNNPSLLNTLEYKLRKLAFEHYQCSKNESASNSSAEILKVILAYINITLEKIEYPPRKAPAYHKFNKKKLKEAVSQLLALQCNLFENDKEIYPLEALFGALAKLLSILQHSPQAKNAWPAEMFACVFLSVMVLYLKQDEEFGPFSMSEFCKPQLKQINPEITLKDLISLEKEIWARINYNTTLIRKDDNSNHLIATDDLQSLGVFAKTYLQKKFLDKMLADCRVNDDFFHLISSHFTAPQALATLSFFHEKELGDKEVECTPNGGHAALCPPYGEIFEPP